MAAVTRVSAVKPSIAHLNIPQVNKHSGNLYAGMVLSAYDACYINTDGKVYRSLDTGAATRQSCVDGFAAIDAKVGQAVTLFYDLEIGYAAASGMTPGARLYLSASVAGGLDTVASNSHAPCGHAVTDTIAYLRKFLV